MKASIIRPDGSWLYVEGTPEEIRALTSAPMMVPFAGPTIAICTCYGRAGLWCPLHGYQWQPGQVIYGVQTNACAGNALPYFTC